MILQRDNLSASRLGLITAMTSAPVMNQVWPATGWTFPWIKAEDRPKPFLEEARAWQTPHLMSPTVGARYRLRRVPLLKSFWRHQENGFLRLATTFVRRICRAALRRFQAHDVHFRRLGVSPSFNRPRPRIASPAIARASVRDAFSDSGRSRRMPKLLAHSLNAMSMS